MVYLTVSLANKSSAMPVTPGTVSMTAPSFWKTSKLTNRPKGSQKHIYFTQGMLNIISNELSLSSQTIH